MSDDDALRAQLEGKADDELLEMLRDRESGEWRPEALAAAEAILTARGVALPAPEAPSADEMEFEDLVMVAGFMNHVDAETCRSALQGAGFDALSRDTSTLRADNLLAPMMGGVRIGVPRDQAEDALAFLKAAESGELAASVACPACGSEDTAAETRKEELGRVGNMIASLVPLVEEEVWFRCRACGQEWQ